MQNENERISQFINLVAPFVCVIVSTMIRIRTALEQGRLCDFFSLVRSILNTYSPDSPYVSLYDWCGVAC